MIEHPILYCCHVLYMLFLKAILAMPRISFVFKMYLARRFTMKAISNLALFTRYITSPMWTHWKGIKDILCYLRGTLVMGLFYPWVLSFNLIGFVDTLYLFDPYRGQSQTGYIFTNNGTTISWRSTNKLVHLFHQVMLKS